MNPQPLRYIIATVIALVIPTAAQEPADGSQQPTVFRAKTNLVVVPVTATGRDGRFVFGLTRDDFEIRDDGTRRHIVQFSADRAPLSLAVLLDISGSMMHSEKVEEQPASTRWTDTRRALELLIGRLDARDEVLFAVFNETTALALPWTEDHPAVLRTFDTLKPGGATALLDAVALISPAFQMARHTRKVLLLISDGQDSRVPPPSPTRGQRTTYMGVPIEVESPASATSNRWALAFTARLASARDAVTASDAALYAIGAGTRKGAYVNVKVLQSLTADAGGYVERLDDPAQIPDALARICDDLQAQYVLAFEPSHADGKTHKISVNTRNRSVRIRARSTYLAAP